MRPSESEEPPREDAFPEVEGLLRAEPRLEWRPELTRAVVARARRRRRFERLGLAAAAALLVVAALLGAEVVADEPLVTGAADRLAEWIPALPSPGAVLESVAGTVTVLSGTSGGNGAALPLAVAALVLLVALNGAVVVRPLVVRRRAR